MVLSYPISDPLLIQCWTKHVARRCVDQRKLTKWVRWKQTKPNRRKMEYSWTLIESSSGENLSVASNMHPGPSSQAGRLSPAHQRLVIEPRRLHQVQGNELSLATSLHCRIFRYIDLVKFKLDNTCDDFPSRYILMSGVEKSYTVQYEPAAVPFGRSLNSVYIKYIYNYYVYSRKHGDGPNSAAL